MNYIYARVSTEDQNLQQQVDLLLKKFPDAKVFAEKLSGKNTDRPEFNDLLNQIEKGDRLIVQSIDRLSRSLSDLINIVESFKAKRIHLEIHDLGGLDVTSPTGQMVVSVLGSVAQMQREQTLEKTRIGIERAKSEGKFKGKQVSDRTLKAVEQAKAFIDKGLSKPQAAKAAGIGVMTLYRHLNGSYEAIS